MLNLCTAREAWPDETRPLGRIGWDRESFANWWERNRTLLGHLHEKIAEQWVYRHWEYTSYRCIPLQHLNWSEEFWTTQRILEKTISNLEFEPPFDFQTFTGNDTPTGKPFLTKGTWDYPIVVLHTPCGVQIWGRDFPLARYLLIEGHQRLRLLNAYHQLKKPMESKHKLFVLEWRAGKSF